MTTATTHPVPDTAGDGDVASDSLLRVALRADATLCGALGLVIAMAADALSRVSGLSATSEWIGGAALVGYGAALFLAAGAPDVRRVGTGVLVGNVVFALVVGVVLATGLLPLTEAGVVGIAGFTAITLAFAYAQYLGVRRLTSTPS
ncbi:hypothetical protein H7I77_04235 [Mycolicibacterium novocastrense]|uniref:Integral membrane protein n=1 Tax=Mycolicibacterium novocastrense TaxID=59813 RepID=A0AAW5SGC7_MYCNV|nr:hypothetical protein [Mycolicibacterium novocastrense]MCV7022561.1 hypothetical protein [Mycolicibacterium novocastrense]GAT08227.1 uncharacterized protein RMCN_1360 [Mycolicibacterium novocastrense]